MVTLNNTTSKNPYLDNVNLNSANQTNSNKEVSSEDENLEQIMEKSAIEVSLSMNAQIVLFAMDSEKLSKDTMAAQKDIFNLLSGKETESGFSLEDLGYEGKPITELSEEEATELISEEGFFGIEQTSQRVADFALSFSDDPEIIKQALEGIKKGFEEAEELWGGELPEISYKTQERTLELINEKLAELEGTSSKEEPAEESVKE